MTEARPLEVLVAETLLGLPVFCIGDDLPKTAPDEWVEQMASGEFHWCGRDFRRNLVHYLRSWSGLGLVVEAMRERGWRLYRLEEQRCGGGDWHVMFAHVSGNRVQTNSAMSSPDGQQTLGDQHPWTAAFVAALRALGVPEEEIQQALEATDV